MISADYNGHFGCFPAGATIDVDVEITLLSLVDLDGTLLPEPRVSSAIRRRLHLFFSFGDNDNSALEIVTKSLECKHRRG